MTKDTTLTFQAHSCKFWSNKKDEMQIVDGEKILGHGFDYATLNLYQCKNGFIVIEDETGHSIGVAHETRDAALDEALQILSEKTADEFHAAIQQGHEAIQWAVEHRSPQLEIDFD